VSCVCLCVFVCVCVCVCVRRLESSSLRGGVAIVCRGTRASVRACLPACVRSAAKRAKRRAGRLCNAEYARTSLSLVPVCVSARRMLRAPHPHPPATRLQPNSTQRRNLRRSTRATGSAASRPPTSTTARSSYRAQSPSRRATGWAFLPRAPTTRACSSARATGGCACCGRLVGCDWSVLFWLPEERACACFSCARQCPRAHARPLHVSPRACFLRV
jgi:hypothetical protein